MVSQSLSLDTWLAECSLPSSLGETLREHGYDGPDALTDAEGNAAVTLEQLKEWQVLPWHRRKFMAAVADLVTGHAAAAAGAAGAAAAAAAGAAERDEQQGRADPRPPEEARHGPGPLGAVESPSRSYVFIFSMFYTYAM